jgi:hypothetical protein
MYGVDQVMIIQNDLWHRWINIMGGINTDYNLDSFDIPLVKHSRRGDFSEEEFFGTIRKNGILETAIKSSTHKELENYWADEGLWNGFKNDLYAHGVYATKYFLLKNRSYVISKLLKEPIDKNILIEIGKPFVPEALFKRGGTLIEMSNIILDYLIDLYKYRIKTEEKDIVDHINMWLEKSNSIRYCSYCGSPFILSHIPDWLYCACGIQDCCFLCEIVEFPNKNEAVPRIREFVEACGFIPMREDTISRYSFMARIVPEFRRQVIIKFAKMGRQKYIASMFGSWFEGLRYSSVLPGNILFTKRGVKCIASDGHICLSLGEFQIDEWLIKHGIPHEKEPYYPVHNEFNQNGMKRGDWKVGDVFIEYLGLLGDEKYDKNSEVKLQLAEAIKLPIIVISPIELGNLDNLLDRFLE